MRKSIVFIIVAVFVVFVVNAVSLKAEDAKLETSVTSKDVNKAAEQAKKIKVQEPKVDPAYIKRASQMNKKFNSAETQAELNKYKEQARRILAQNPNAPVAGQTKIGSGNEKTGVLLPTERVYVFISQSVPLSTLRSYASDIDNSGEENVVMVMRGFVGGMKKMKPTMTFISRIISKDEMCDLVTAKNPKCEVFDAEVIVDPTLFERFGITAVPGVVFADGITTGPDVSYNMSSGNPQAYSISNTYTAYGDMSLSYVMDQVFKSTKNPRVAALSKKFRGGYYK